MTLGIRTLRARSQLENRLGHGSVAMTLDLYAHASPGLQQAAAQCFDKALESDSNVSETEEMSRA